MKSQNKVALKEAIILVDNGSLRPESIHTLRAVAEKLEKKTGTPVYPASYAHSHRINPEFLDGKSASLFQISAETLIEEGYESLQVIPFVFATYGAIFNNILEIAENLKRLYPSIHISVADALHSENDPLAISISAVLADLSFEAIIKHSLKEPVVLTVDHGSPHEAAAIVRNQITENVGRLLGEQAKAIHPSSMESRDGIQYAFNQPLLENALEDAYLKYGAPIVLARIFLQPGRHAGAGGDVDTIVERVRTKYTGLKVYPTELMASHPGIVFLLERRYRQLESLSKI